MAVMIPAVTRDSIVLRSDLALDFGPEPRLAAVQRGEEFLPRGEGDRGAGGVQRGGGLDEDDGRLPRPVDVVVADIRMPVFLVGTERDHISPWRSVYKLHHLTDTEITFVLTNGGHNAGIVAGPVHPKRHYRIRTRRLADPHLAPQDWLEEATKHDGSWWPAWQGWLAEHSSSRTKPVPLGNSINPT